jgi:protocatechuate 3,4-dioxygenase beta subunit
MLHEPRGLRHRRLLLKAGIAVPALLWLPRAAARPTPPCGAETPPQTAGPFFTPDSPAKADFRADDPAGAPVILLLQVVDTGCQAVPGAVVDLWHANSAGRYDNDGFHLRGHQRADERGKVAFSTVLPGAYAFRTRHYHLRILRDGRRLLTTQLYFPGEPGNADDGLFQPELLMEVARAGAALDARFRLVVEA